MTPLIKLLAIGIFLLIILIIGWAFVHQLEKSGIEPAIPNIQIETIPTSSVPVIHYLPCDISGNCQGK